MSTKANIFRFYSLNIPFFHSLIHFNNIRWSIIECVSIQYMVVTVVCRVGNEWVLPSLWSMSASQQHPHRWWRTITWLTSDDVANEYNLWIYRLEWMLLQLQRKRFIVEASYWMTSYHRSFRFVPFLMVVPMNEVLSWITINMQILNFFGCVVNLWKIYLQPSKSFIISIQIMHIRVVLVFALLKNWTTQTTSITGIPPTNKGETSRLWLI